MEETIDRLESGIAAYRESKRRRLNRPGATPPDGGGVGGDFVGEHNLVQDVPVEAWDLWQRWKTMDDPRESEAVKHAWEDYPEKDLAKIIEDATDNGKIVNLGSETYTLKETNLPIELTADHQLFGVVGDEGNPATIHYNEVSEGRTFFFKTKNNKEENSVEKAYLANVTFNIEGDLGGGLTPDAGIIRLIVEDEFWAHNVVLEGARKRWQSVDGGYPVEVGGYSTWLVDVTSEEGTAFHHRVKLDGGMELDPDVAKWNVDEDGHPDPAVENFKGSRGVKFTQGIPFSNGDNHKGYAVYKDCSVSDSPGSGWYIGNKWNADDYDVPQPDSPSMVSENVLWNCEAHNCSMRIGNNDKIIGGKVVYDDYWLRRAYTLAEYSSWSVDEWLKPPGGAGGLLAARALDLEEGAVEVIGLSIEADLFSKAIDVRKYLDHAILDRVVLETGSLDEVDEMGAVAHFSNRAESDTPVVEIKDCFWYDSNESRTEVPNKFRKVDVIANGWQFATEHAGADVFIKSFGSLAVDSETIPSSSDVYYEAADLKVDDPRPLSDHEYGFNYDTEYDPRE